MVEIPQSRLQEPQKTLEEWYKLKQELNKIKAQEMLLRTAIFKHYFIDPKEGTNTVDLEDGYKLKGKHTITRKVMEESLQAMSMRRGANRDEPSILEAAGISPATLVRWKPELNVSVYRTLTEEQVLIADQMLLIEDGSPAIEIAPPSVRKAKNEHNKEHD